MANIGKIYKHGLDRPSTYWDDFLGRAGLKKLWQRCRSAFISIDNDGSKYSRSIKTLNGHKIYKDNNDPTNKADNLLLQIDDITDYKVMSADDVKDIINSLTPTQSVKLTFTANKDTTVKVYFTKESYDSKTSDDTISLTANQEKTTTYNRENIYTFTFDKAIDIISAKIDGVLLYCKFLFDNCSALTSLNVTELDTSNVTDMVAMFSGCSKLTTLDLSNWNTSNVTDMGNMFEGCSGLTTLDLTNFDTSKVTTMEYMFSGCSKLTTLDLSNWNTSNVIDMSYMFEGCSGLTTIGPINTSSGWQHTPDAYNDMFTDCSAIPRPTWYDE